MTDTPVVSRGGRAIGLDGRVRALCQWSASVGWSYPLLNFGAADFIAMDFKWLLRFL